MSHQRSTLALPWALAPGHEERWQRIRAGGVVCLDYDGTLTPIVDRPEQAVLPAAMRLALRRLAAVLPVAIVSGRDVGVVAGFVQLDGLAYVGSHGLDIVGFPGSGLRRELALDFVPALDGAEGWLRREAADIAGVIVERKRFSVSTHVRLVAPTERARVDALVARVQRAHPSLRREGGKLVHELRPDIAWDKGRAVRWLLEAQGRDLASALFIGDDLTDETAFRVLAGRGTGVVVADTERPTAAELRLGHPGEVQTLLERLAGG